MRKVFLLFSLISLLSTALIQEFHPQISPTEKITFGFNDRFPTFSSDSLRLMSFGYPRILSGLLWVRFLIQTPPERVPENELSWIYFDLDSITNIDPDFLPAFEIGGLFLSVVTTDKKGAELLMEKGLAHYPNSWKLHSYLAYHYEYEVNKKEKAGPHYLAAAKIPGAPYLMGILAARQLSKSTSIQTGIEFLENMKKNSDNENTRKRIQERIDMWKKKQISEAQK